MNVYSNAFFHRVLDHKAISSIDIIKHILEEGFRLFYCKEEIFLGEKKPSSYIGIPMVSFCDIPLTLVANNHYGKCGIAMTRTWGNARHLEPVLYYPNDVSCQSTRMIIKAEEVFSHDRRNYDDYRILGYAKPMKKPTRIPGRSSDNYVEREWRRVYANPAPMKWLTADEYDNYRGDPDSLKIPVGAPLRFSVNDIQFLLIDQPNKASLQNFIMTVLPGIGGKKGITDHDRYELLSKILVYEDLIHNL